MNKKCLCGLLLFTLFFQKANAQVSPPILAKDNGMNGQIKRMVFQQWDDWAPGGFKGLLFWQITHHSYRHGKDRRPYKVGGKADQIQAQLSLQKGQEDKIEEMTKKEAKQDEATLLSMSGGALDVPYQIYFKGVFKKLLTEVDDFAHRLQNVNPLAYTKFYNDAYVKYYREEYLPMMTDRIKVVNSGISPRGERMLSYIKIENDLDAINKKVIKIGEIYNGLANLNESKNIQVTLPENNGGTNTDGYKSDDEIVEDIMSHVRF